MYGIDKIISLKYTIVIYCFSMTAGIVFSIHARTKHFHLAANYCYNVPA